MNNKFKSIGLCVVGCFVAAAVNAQLASDQPVVIPTSKVKTQIVAAPASAQTASASVSLPLPAAKVGQAAMSASIDLTQGNVVELLVSPATEHKAVQVPMQTADKPKGNKP